MMPSPERVEEIELEVRGLLHIFIRADPLSKPGQMAIVELGIEPRHIVAFEALLVILDRAKDGLPVVQESNERG